MPGSQTNWQLLTKLHLYLDRKSPLVSPPCAPLFVYSSASCCRYISSRNTNRDNYYSVAVRSLSLPTFMRARSFTEATTDEYIEATTKKNNRTGHRNDLFPGSTCRRRGTSPTRPRGIQSVGHFFNSIILISGSSGCMDAVHLMLLSLCSVVAF